MKYLNFIVIIMCCCVTTSCFDEVTADIPVSIFDFDSGEEYITMGNINVVPTGQNGVYRAEGIVSFDKEIIPESYQQIGRIRYYWGDSYLGDIAIDDFPVNLSESMFSGDTRCFRFELRIGDDISKSSEDFCATAP
ncbi:MAG: hypothetical protein AB8G11_21550 [Saprospiraceae bacterium]